MSKYLCLFFVLVQSIVFGDFYYTLKSGEELRITLVKSPEEIPQECARNILVSSFMTAYEDVPLSVLNPDFKSTGDVRRFYQQYYKEEYEHFEHGGLTWILAFIDNELVGWATFEFENDSTAYMNLLTIDPTHMKKGVGKQLTFSILSYFPEIKEITLLIRKVNVEGMKFYQSIGFEVYPTARTGNFVDLSLLDGMHWVQK